MGLSLQIAATAAEQINAQTHLEMLFIGTLNLRCVCVGRPIRPPSHAGVSAERNGVDLGPRKDLAASLAVFGKGFCASSLERFPV